MSISLTQPGIGTFPWGGDVNGNWQTIEDAINRSGSDTADPAVCEGRLTLTTSVPVTTTDVTGTTLYFTPFNGDRIALYDGTRWIMRTFTELTRTTSNISAGASGSANVNYDVFAYDNSGTVAVEGLAWSSDTARATALVVQDGMLVKSGAATRRYIGTIRLNGSTQFEDTITKRFVWNYLNRVHRKLLVQEATSSWTYATASWRAANGSNANRVEFVRGVSEDPVRATVSVAVLIIPTANNRNLAVGIGLDTTSANSAKLFFGRTSGQAFQLEAHYGDLPSAGYHYLQWVELGGNGANWLGTGSYPQSGLVGIMHA